MRIEIRRTLTRSMILTRPQSSIEATSPVCTQPSSSTVSLVFFSSVHHGTSASSTLAYSHSTYSTVRERKRKMGKRTFIIPLERILAPTAQLAARERLILRRVSHSRHVDELELNGDGWRTGRPARRWVVVDHMGADGGVFGHPVAVQRYIGQ